MSKPIYKEKFLGYEIINVWNSDGWVLCDDGCSIANCSTLEDAQRYAVLFFMIERPKDFSNQIFHRTLRQFSGSVHEWFKFVSVLKQEKIKLPKEMTCTDDGNCMILCNGKRV